MSLAFLVNTGILKGPTIFEEFRLEISCSVSTAATWERELFGCEGPMKAKGSLPASGMVSASF